MKSKIITATLLATIFTQILSDQIICNFDTFDNHYTCDATIENPLGAEVLPITGTHKGYNEDYNVARVNVIGGESRTMPSSFCTVFTYLKIIETSWNVAMTRITVNSFAACTELRELHLKNNYFSSISSLFLINNVKLLKFTLTDYPKYWNVNFLINQGNLNELNLIRNNFRGFPRNSVNSNALESLILNNNKISILESQPFGNLSKLKVLEITNNNMEAIDRRIFEQAVDLREVRALGNICIDKDFPTFDPVTHLVEFEGCFNAYDPVNEEFVSPPYEIQWHRIVSNSVRVSVMVSEDATVRFSPLPNLLDPTIGVVLGDDGNTAVTFYENGYWQRSNIFNGLLNAGQMETFQFDFNDDLTSLMVVHLDENDEPRLNVLNEMLGVTSGINPAYIGVFAGSQSAEWRIVENRPSFG